MLPIKKREYDRNIVETMQIKLKTVTKVKLSYDRQICNLYNTERALSEELHSLKAEIEYLTEQLEDLKDNISETSYRTVKLDIEKAAEMSKLNCFTNDLVHHQMDFNEMFAEERRILDRHNKELQAWKAEEQEALRQRQKQKKILADQLANEAAALDEQAETIERECAVLKKRNNAIMLKLRRKLIQTEDARRELINRTNQNETAL